MYNRSTGVPAAVDAPRLRDIEHPDLSPTLVHFVDRGRPTGPGAPAEIDQLSAVERLDAIVMEGEISAFVTYSGGDPAVCMTETSWEGLTYLIQRRNYAPWALMFDRQKVYDAGGGPVWYARPDEYAALKARPELRAWAVELSDRSDWLHEREWRIPLPASDGMTPSIPLAALGLCGVIVGDPYWDCATLEHEPALGDGSEAYHYLPQQVRILAGVPRYWWNADTGRFAQL